MTSEKYWYRVLNHFENGNYFNNGLTIPFLIGCRVIVEPNKELQSIKEFVTEMRDSQYALTIMKCGQLNEYVVGLLDQETNSFRKQYKNKMYREFGSLLITDNSFDDIYKFEELIADLENNYNDKIEKRCFSKEFGEWGEFSSTDKTRLNEVVIIERPK